MRKTERVLEEGEEATFFKCAIKFQIRQVKACLFVNWNTTFLCTSLFTTAIYQFYDELFEKITLFASIGYLPVVHESDSIRFCFFFSVAPADFAT